MRRAPCPRMISCSAPSEVATRKMCIRDREIYDAGHRLVRSVPVSQQISGYEYEVLACKRAIEQGLCECPEMPHEASCHVMALADSLRRQWGVRFPQEIEA